MKYRLMCALFSLFVSGSVSAKWKYGGLVSRSIDKIGARLLAKGKGGIAQALLVGGTVFVLACGSMSCSSMSHGRIGTGSSAPYYFSPAEVTSFAERVSVPGHHHLGADVYVIGTGKNTDEPDVDFFMGEVTDVYTNGLYKLDVHSKQYRDGSVVPIDYEFTITTQEHTDKRYGGRSFEEGGFAFIGDEN